MNLKAKSQPEQSRQEEQIPTAVNAHWHAPAIGDANAEHDIYHDDAICDYPQSGERILGRSNLQPCGVIIPATRPASRSAGFSENGNLWITEYTITYQHALIGGPLVPAHCRLSLRCSHAAVLRQESASISRSTGLPPRMCDSTISSTSASVTCPYQTASG
jgi:hypothetical protein